ncbi:MAG: transpeptidase family protein [candidate division Zixibacteria bacterium]|nr:transpeptidase family protein [candidate division Zixibacteria bacterium]
MASRFPIGVSKGRARLLLSLSLLVWGGLVLRLAQIQIFSAPRYAKMVREQERGVKILAGSRGVIYDRNGEVLAKNLATYSFFSFAESLSAPRFLAQSVFRGKLSEREIGQKKKRKGFVWLARDVEKEEAGKILARKPRGIYVTPEEKRAYPYYPLGVDWLGFTSVDGAGQAGLELYYEKHLRGDSARLPFVRDARGRTFSLEEKQARPKSGRSLTTTIDFRMQSVLEEELEQALEKSKAAGAWGIFMNPKTGEIWAMASRLSGNPDPRAARQKNRLVADMFEPGSTFKLVTAAAALEKKKFSPRSLVHGENGKYKIGKRTIRDVHPHEYLTFEDAVVKSSNIALAKIGLAIGGSGFYETAKKFGFGEKSGVDLPGEASGRFPSQEALAREIRLATCSYGYGASVTALQLVSAYGAVANGGVRMKPYIVREIRNEKGELVQQNLPTPVGEAVSKETARILKRFFSGVVDSGTAQAAGMEGVTVAGKTGTSKKIDPETHRYVQGRYVSSFVGFFPAEEPRVVGFVALDEPKGAYYGGEVAAPIFRKTAEKFLTLLDEPLRPEEPKKESFELLQLAAAAVYKTSEPAGVRRLDEVPDFSGMPVRLALREAAARGLSVRVKGKGVVREQNLPPGSPIDRSEVVLSCRPPFTDE